MASVLCFISVISIFTELTSCPRYLFSSWNFRICSALAKTCFEAASLSSEKFSTQKLKNISLQRTKVILKKISNLNYTFFQKRNVLNYIFFLKVANDGLRRIAPSLSKSPRQRDKNIGSMAVIKPTAFAYNNKC